MRTSNKSIITAALVMPLLLIACDRADQSPTTGSGTTQEKMATNPSAPPVEQTPEKSQPSPADLSRNPVAPSSSTPLAPPADQTTEPKRNN